jgi:hypothetical protein
VAHEGVVIAVDEYDGHLAGLVTAEIDIGDGLSIVQAPRIVEVWHWIQVSTGSTSGVVAAVCAALHSHLVAAGRGVVGAQRAATTTTRPSTATPESALTTAGLNGKANGNHNNPPTHARLQNLR